MFVKTPAGPRHHAKSFRFLRPFEASVFRDLRDTARRLCQAGNRV